MHPFFTSVTMFTRSRLSVLLLLIAATCCLYAAHILSSRKATEARTQAATFACSNGIDDDRDGRTDYPADDGCLAPFDGTEFAENTVPSEGAIRLTISDGRDFANPDETLVYRVTVINRELYPRVLNVKMQLPNKLSLLDVTGNHTNNAGAITWNQVSLAPRESRTYIVTARIDRDAPRFYGINAKAYVGSVIATDSTVVTKPGEEPGAVEVEISDALRSAKPGDLLSYTITLHNRTQSAVSNVLVNAVLPGLTDFQSASDGGQWNGSGIAWKNLTIAPLASRDVYLTARVRPDARPGSVLQASVSAKNSRAFDKTDVLQYGSVATTPNRPVTYVPATPAPVVSAYPSDGTLLQTASRSEVHPGDIVRFTLTYTNTQSAPATGVVVTSRFDSAYIRAIDSAELHWVLPALQPGQTWSTTYTAQVAANAPHGLRIQSSATARCTSCGTQSSSNVQLGVVAHLPQTGAAFDALFTLLTCLAAGGVVTLQSRKA